VLVLSSCRSCSKEPSNRDAPLSEPRSDGASLGTKTRTIAVTREPLDHLVEGRGELYGIERGRGAVVALSEGDEDAAPTVRELVANEHAPFALVVRGGKPVWASADGIFGWDDDGRRKRAIVSRPDIRALGSGPHDILFADTHGISRVEWPAAAHPVSVVPDVVADEVAGTSEAVIWIERGIGKVWAYDLRSAKRVEVAGEQREPHDLAVASDERSISWHEGGDGGHAPPRAFLADIAAGTVRELPGRWDPSAHYVIQGSCVVGPGTCKSVATVEWIVLDQGKGTGAVAVGSGKVFWAESLGDGVFGVLAAPISSCCR
jgi:hypothetical protein